MNKLYVEILDKKGNKTYRIEGNSATIGRATGNDITIKDSTVSRKHAEIFFKENRWYIKDLKSTNGTFVNGKKVKGEMRLYEKDIVEIGKRSIIPIKLPSGMEIGKEKIPQDITYFIGDLEKRKWARIMEGIEEIGKELVALSSYDRILNRVAEVAREILNVERAFVVLKKENKFKLAATSVKKGIEGGITISESILKRAMESKVGIITQDALSDKRFSGQKSIMNMKIRSAVCVPIWRREEVLGAIYVDSSIDKRIHTEEDVELLSILGNYVAVVIEQKRIMEELKKQQRMRERLEKYHSPAVVQRIFSKGLETTFIPRKFFMGEGTVLFADVVGFTSLVSEGKPEEIGNLLNEFLSRMTDIVFKYEGTLDKYLGDGVMAVFGIPMKQENHEERALRTAIEMQREIENTKWKKPLKIRIGINSGGVIAGDFGSEKRLEFTVIGHSVNIASRLQSEIAPPGRTAVGEKTYEKTKEKFEFESLGKVKVKGIKEKMDAYLLKEEKK